MCVCGVCVYGWTVYTCGILGPKLSSLFPQTTAAVPAALRSPPAEAGDAVTLGQDRRLCHCSTAVRWALTSAASGSFRGPEEYWPMTILPMKSLLLFMLWPNTNERAGAGQC